MDSTLLIIIGLILVVAATVSSGFVSYPAVFIFWAISFAGGWMVGTGVAQKMFGD